MTLDDHALLRAVICCRELAKCAGELAPEVGVKLGMLDGRAVILTLSAKPEDVVQVQTRAYEAFTDSL